MIFFKTGHIPPFIHFNASTIQAAAFTVIDFFHFMAANMIHQKTKQWVLSCKRWTKERKRKKKKSPLTGDYPCLWVQTASPEQNKAHDWRDDVPFIRLCSGVGLPGCRHTPHTQPSASDNNNTHQQILRTRKTYNLGCVYVRKSVSKLLFSNPHFCLVNNKLVLDINTCSKWKY